MGICYTGKQVSEILGIPEGTLQYHRFKKIGLPFVKVGGLVRYRKEDVDAYLEANLQAPEGYVRPEPEKASSEAIQKPAAGKPKLTDWKSDVLGALLSHGIISKRFTGKISLEIENGVLKTARKNEDL